MKEGKADKLLYMTVADLMEPRDREYAAWEAFILAEKEYEERHGEAEAEGAKNDR